MFKNSHNNWESTNSRLRVAAGDRPATGEHLYFELPAGIAIDSLKTQVHLFLFDALPPDPWQALQNVTNSQAQYTCKVLGAENLQGNIELKAHWQIETLGAPTLRRVPSGLHRPVTATGMQQVRAEVEAPSVLPYDYQFEREKLVWSPVFSDREELHPTAAPHEKFPIPDTRWQKESRQGWKLVVALNRGEGAAMEKDAAPLERAKPDSGSFLLVSLRRRRRDKA